ncbi:MAG: hypothetical protein Harvfovirus1_25 [Harvfovirus sp.]|uniref:Uncharacterized protein n=1 Tax=Harvfovirus sp. TaxID=2487768 RepID=A0A3G4ZZV5_9VIRU|nr:MAG: hypothetical protein Harvfovirus1_25 [Harvfovirus sp.]
MTDLEIAKIIDIAFCTVRDSAIAAISHEADSEACHKKILELLNSRYASLLIEIGEAMEHDEKSPLTHQVTNPKSIGHGPTEYFRIKTDDFLTINGYSGCDLCNAYDKRYSLVDKEGRVLTEFKSMPRSFVKTFIDNTYLFCGECSTKYNLLSVKRGDFKYAISEDHSSLTLPEPNAIGKIIMSQTTMKKN